ncbi:MAG: SAM-dependent chlorinase/fluorinase [Desulfobacterales bacterium]|nr:SAM-dependent chlorinase/fluorinase [Desulfobacterales bacterium]MDD4071629.1 SAM-dependent chlorinase/fluorinase [Desulfobacterales bacterium]MDD4391629.1 SAM-dependent chlorinase/fluorinase [Desulfobacterales bacterium]
MPVITLLTDFGLSDEYVGVLRGVILSMNPSAVIVDISHQIDPQDLMQAAYIIQAAYPYFPKHTIHVIGVDPGVGSRRDIIALECGGAVFIAPDNGVLTFVMDHNPVESAVRLDQPAYWLTSVSRTFHGRDIFAPVAAHLSMGLDIRKLGTAVNPNELVRLPLTKPYVSESGELIGQIMSIDRFGNLITNIDTVCLEGFNGQHLFRHLEICIGACKIKGLSESYSEAGPKGALSIIGSRGFLEIAVNGGNAARCLGARKNDLIRIQIPVRDASG